MRYNMNHKIDPEKCETLARQIIKNYYDFLEQLGNPDLTRDIGDQIRLHLENQIPCSMAFGFHERYAGQEKEAQEARERIYNVGQELCQVDDPFMRLAESQE